MRKQNRVLPVSMVIVIAGILALQACGSGSLFGSSGVTRSAGGFTLTSIPDRSMQDQSARELRLDLVEAREGANEVCLVISLDNARGCKAAYFKLDYDSARYTPVAVDTGPALQERAGPGKLLELSILNQPGTLYHGQCLAGWDRLTGFSGDGLLATVRFARRPYTAQARAASTPPNSALSQTTLAWDEPSATLSWRFYSQGDYNQDGEVGINDLTPLGMYFAQTCSYPADENTAKACADGDHNGELNISDITPIGNNFGKNALGGWKVYGTSDVAQYPNSPSDDNGTANTEAILSLGDFDPSTTRASDRLLYRTTLLSPVPGDVYWVRPVDSANVEGIASNYAPGGSTSNHDPVITALELSTNSVSSGGFIIMLVQASDPDGDPLTYSKSASSGVIVTDGDERPESFEFTFPTVATDTTYTITGWVDDGRGGTDTLSQDIQVIAPVVGNSPPTITSVTPVQSTISSGGTTSVACVASDVDGDPLEYTWITWGRIGYFEGSGPTVTYLAPAVTIYTDAFVYVSVDDGHGHIITDTSLTIHITAGTANTPPTAVLVSGPASGPAPLLVDFDASGSYDTDGSISTYDWDWEGDGTYEVLGSVSAQTYTYTSAGTFNPVVRVTDNLGATDTDTDSIVVGSAATWHISLIPGRTRLAGSARWQKWMARRQ